MVELINTHCDKVLCVSNRVGEVAARYGIAPQLITTSYIGTRHAEKFAETMPRPAITRADGTLTLAYLGYMRRDKGFFFLLEALEALPDETAAKVNLMICSRLIDQPTMDRLTALSDRFASLLFADGYAHDQLDELLSEALQVTQGPLYGRKNELTMPDGRAIAHGESVEIGGNQNLLKPIVKNVTR